MGQPMDGRADLYALAATTYHLLTGSPPFDHPNPAVVISRHLNSGPPALASRRPDLAGLDPVLATAMAKDPIHRFRRCDDFARALTAYADRRTGTAPSAPILPAIAPPPRSTAVLPLPPPATAGGATGTSGSTRWRPVSVGVVIALLFLASVMLVWRPWQQDQATRMTATPTTSSIAPSITYAGMRDFVTGYYGQLPAHATDAWEKLDTAYQNRTGLRDYLDFWSGMQSVALVSVSPRDASSVVVQLRYVRLNGSSDTEDRWVSMVLVNGQMLISDSQRIGPA